MQPAAQYKVLTFYKYVNLPHASLLREAHLRDGQSIGVRGRILISGEGINGAACGTIEQTENYKRYLHSFPEFADLTFREQKSHFNTFKKLHVRVKNEVINSGIGPDPKFDPNKKGGKHIDPEELRKLKDDPDVVLLDVRSNYEHNIGKFKDAVTLNIGHFRDFPEKIKELEQLKDKKIITYCTGGVKCEKASAILRENGFQDVYQLRGGIVQYANETGGEDFQGRCYVFDRRVAVDVNKVNPEVISHCVHCNRKTARYVNCVNSECNEQVIMCQACSFQWKGACSEACCQNSGRTFNGLGYYEKELEKH